MPHEIGVHTDKTGQVALPETDTTLLTLHTTGLTLLDWCLVSCSEEATPLAVLLAKHLLLVSSGKGWVSHSAR